MIESLDDFEEKRDDEKQTLQSVILELDCIPHLLIKDQSLEQQ